jgi:hypothetical protein
MLLRGTCKTRRKMVLDASRKGCVGHYLEGRLLSGNGSLREFCGAPESYLWHSLSLQISLF